jgi:glycosyltransferase involved in cell wall biosynthesis
MTITLAESLPAETARPPAMPPGAAPGRPVYIDGRFLTQPASGIQRYAEEIVRAIDRLGAVGEIDGTWTLLVPPGARVLPLAWMRSRIVGARGGHLWTQIAFARAARDGVALSLAASAPVAHRRALVVIHDATVFVHPEFFSTTYGMVHRTLGRALARTARIATVSSFSRGELARVTGLSSAAIAVAHNGADHLGRVNADAAVLARLGLADGVPYFVTLGNFTRNKNLGVAVQALGAISDTGARLVMIGAQRADVFGADGLPQRVEGVIQPGRLDDAEVVALLRGARALVFPSIYEGFGIPPLEAMANDCPVLGSTAGAVREVCGDAAALFDPHDAAALADLMRGMIADEPRRAAMMARGRQRVAAYRWADSARVLVDLCGAMAGV